MSIRYSVEVRHEGLHKFRVVSGTDRYVVEQKALAQSAAWDEQWQRQQQRQAATDAKQQVRDLAAERTRQAVEVLSEVDATLARTLAVDDRVDWETLKDHSPFPTAAPVPSAPLPRPPEPRETDVEFQARLGFLDKVLKGRRERLLSESRAAFGAAHRKWLDMCEYTQQQEHARHVEYETALARWEADRLEFEKAKALGNAAIDERRWLYEAKDPGAIVDYCDLVLSRSDYPDFMPQSYELDYVPESGILVVDYALPSPDRVPTVKGVKVTAGDGLAEVLVAQREATARYDSLLYQVCLRTIHELLEGDTADALRAVAFNGWVTSTDPGTGKDVKACVLTVGAMKEAFMGIDLSRAEPKACFKSLKGVGSSSLHSLAPVAPLLSIDREDRRFIDGREVISTVDDSVNLAAMDWEDFEHLVKQLFEAEFAAGGGEVRVTQASRDGGVDAVAFDLDPIGGGKLIIQAKRYTNVVGVSAVRDLYGTVVNEGAIKGILVTTSDYGPDAYEFAKGKPLTLLSGSNLLHLLEKHGHRARIDVKEAKSMLKERDGAG
jgi:restriction system protein